MRWSRGLVWCLVPLVTIGLTAAGSRTSLIDAVRQGDATAVRAALQQHADVNAVEADGTTALHWAAHRNDVAAVDLLIQAGADVGAANRYGVTALSLAAENGHAAVIERLLKAGADPNAAMAGGETALMTAARTGDAGAVEALLAHGADANASERTRGQTALMWAAAAGNVAAIGALVDGGADLHAQSNGPTTANAAPLARAVSVYRDYARKGRIDAFTPLMFAAYSGQLEAVRTLLERGADVNDTAEDGTSALVVAINNAHWELAELLVRQGADPNAARQGWTALHQLARSRTLSIGQFPHPVPTGHLTSFDLAKTLIEHGANVNARMTKDMNDGYRSRANRVGATAFFLATKGADTEMMRLLAAHGADVTMTSARHSTPLMMAAGLEMFYPEEDSGTTEDAEKALALALDLGAGDINAANDSGETALHGAAYRESPWMVQTLVDRGARLDAKNKGGQTPLGICIKSRNGPTSATAVLLRKLMIERGLPVGDESATSESTAGTGTGRR